MLIIILIIGVMSRPVAGRGGTIAIALLTATLIACLKDGTNAYRVFTHKKVVYVGLISYSLYLWHWGVLCIGRWTVGVHWWSIPVLTLLIVLCAHASFIFVERPLRYFSTGKAGFRWIIPAGLTTLVLSASGLSAVAKTKVYGLPIADHLYLAANPNTEIVTNHSGNGGVEKTILRPPPWDAKTNSATAKSLLIR